MKKLLIICIAISSLFLFNSCNEDIEVNAPWKDITLVYGLLSKSDSVHFIKINKAFLGEGSADEMAMVRDSSEYASDKITAVISEYVNGNLVEAIPLMDTTIANKETGVFYAPEQTVYYFERELNADATYELTVDIVGKEETVSASTEIIENFNLSGGIVFGNSAVSVGFKNVGGDYVDQNFQFISVNAGKAYQLSMNIYYEEYYADETFEVKSIQWDLPNMTAFNTDGGQQLNQTINGEQFYQQMASKIDPIIESPGVTHRRFLYFQFEMVAAGDELNTYLEVNAPTDALVLDKPQYTNIENGIGIFSTRNTVLSPYEKDLNQSSREELYIGQYTSELGFCGSGGIYACN